MREQKNIDNFEGRIPTEIRGPFQAFLMQKMGIGIGDIDSQINWAQKYAKLVSDIIDNSVNKEIRSFIMEGKNEEASNLVLEILKKEDNKIEIAA